MQKSNERSSRGNRLQITSPDRYSPRDLVEQYGHFQGPISATAAEKLVHKINDLSEVCR